ncbi:Helicase associated domain protein [Agathobacter rectalis]|uniref:Helicase associated domain protein n=1 Tax=Agathobacter rectalis TaxID=39491 RepID=UPI00321A2383
MSRRGTNIRKRTDGRWEGRYYIVDTAGSKKCKSVYGHSYKEVTERLLTAKAASLNQTAAPKQSAITVKAVAEKWLESIASSRKCSTIQKYSTIYNKYIKPNWGESVIDELNQNEILKELPETAGESVTKSILCIFNSILAYGAATYGTGEIHLSYRAKRSSVTSSNNINTINTIDQQKLTEYLLTELDIYKLGILLCLFMGLRLGEICALKWEDIDMISRTLHVNRTVQRLPVDTVHTSDSSQNNHTATKKTSLYIDSPKTSNSLREIPIPDFIYDKLSDYYNTSMKGRALSAGSKNQPVIFDLVNNFDSLYCIDCLKNEMQEAFLLYPDTHSPREHFDDRFRIIDETKDSREIFMRLQENLGSAWDTYYEAAKQWYEENGNLKIPKSYVTKSGLTLGAWINTQRRVKSGNISGNLTWEKIQKLNDIGMIWDVMDSSWQEVLEELKSYRNIYGNLDIKAKYVSPTGFRLGSWINNMRFKVKKYGIEQALTDEQRKALEELGMIWDHNKQKWEEYYSAAKAYYKEYGNLEVPAKYVTADGIPLGRWLSNQTNSHSMTDEQLQRLQSIGYRSESKTAIQWNRKFELAKAYYEKNGNLDVPVSYSTDGVKLGRWISNIRCKRKNPKASGMVLDTERIARLDSIGMNWK